MPFTFQIGMLPRAGSAWLATLLNMHPGVFCFHDALQSYKGKYLTAADSKKDYDHIGDSSSYVCMRPHIERDVFIYRDPAECFESLDELNLAENFHTICGMSEVWQSGTHTLEFKTIFGKDEDASISALAFMFRRLVPGVDLDPAKVRFLRPLKVELLENGPELFDIEEIKRRLP